MEGKRIAAVSTDGIHVDGHFGRAKQFLIFDVGTRITWVEDRETESLSDGDPDHPFDPDKFGRITTLLKDCDEVYVTRIGETPAAKLKALGIEPVVFQGSIADIR